MALSEPNRDGYRRGLLERSHPSLALWIGVGLYAAVVSALHFGGLAYDIYTKIWWWDVLTHTASGFGVAAVVYLFRPAPFRRVRHAAVVVPLFVLLVGAGFEVYERVFRTFWVSWSLGFYVSDTLLDLACDVGGALLFAGLVRARTDRDDGGL